MAKNVRNNGKTVETLTHDEARRKHIPSAEYQSVMKKEEEEPIRVAYERGAAGLEKEKTNRNLDPQLVWRGKDEQDPHSSSIVGQKGKHDNRDLFYANLHYFQ